MGARPRPGSTWSIRTGDPGGDFSTRQLEEFLSWGLIERGPDGWLPDTSDRLRVIRATGLVARSLPRRTLRIYATEPGFPIPAWAFKRAMLELAPMIERAIRKLTTVARARAEMAKPGPAAAVRAGDLPRQRDWERVLAAADEGGVERLRMSWASQATTVLPAYALAAEINLSDIPIEERVVLIALLDLSPPTRHPGPPSILP